MKREIIMLSILFLLFTIYSSNASTIGITEENDVFLHKDNNYTQGIELYYSNIDKNTNGIIEKITIGLRSVMYTPKDITIATNQPNDRPWAGVTTVYHESTEKNNNNDFKMVGWELGVLGPDACSEWQQKTIHKWIGSHTPMGWSNQVPEEICAEYYMSWYHSLLTFGRNESWITELESSYGFMVGTVFDNVSGGLSFRSGYNIPPIHFNDTIEPKLNRAPNYFAYLLADCSEKYVLHNSTLGYSFFRNYQDTEWDRDIIPFVSEADFGACIGWKYVSVSYIMGYRSKEFETQPETFKWGTIKLEFSNSF